MLGFVLCALLLNVPFFATGEHRALEQKKLGMPLCVIYTAFFGLISAYVSLTQLSSSPLVGMMLPFGSTVFRWLALFGTVRAFQKFYYEPKQTWLAQPPSTQRDGHESVLPRLANDNVRWSY